MATRQYIGARYVPKFYTNSVDGSTNWQSNVVYDPLTYVTLTNGHMYISKKQVPATVGTPASNINYWLDIGSYNGFIDELQNQIDALENSLEELTSLVNRGDIICVSDSYGHYPSTTDNWIDFLAARIPNTVYKAEVGGASFGGTIPFTSVLQGIESSISNPDAVGTIIVAGGYNDTTHVADIPAGMLSFANYVAATYKNAKIYVFYVALTNDATRNFTNVTGVLNAYRTYAPNYANMSFVNGSERILRNYNHLDSGGVHPTANGALEIALGVKNYLISNTVVSKFDGVDQHISNSGPNTNAYTDKVLRCVLNNEHITCYITSTFNLEFSTAQSASQLEIGTLADAGFINGTYEAYCRATVPCSVQHNGNWYDGAGQISFSNGKVYFNAPTFRNNIDKLYIPACTFEIPIRWA